ncbi:RCC1/BLIP-II [Violaceomyces palustris]|uniref:RCC1/BLIP-II n=1 Tax=Violaceomyces palustris TaxID=1673888 RepID=A0ACD0NV85_9BASI|nr:RCC1/BLIP-II [Violaceomyces palustris]
MKFCYGFGDNSFGQLGEGLPSEVQLPHPILVTDSPEPGSYPEDFEIFASNRSQSLIKVDSSRPEQPNSRRDHFLCLGFNPQDEGSASKTQFELGVRSDAKRFVGGENFTLFLDFEGKLCDVETLENLNGDCRWKDVAMDNTGRLLAIDDRGKAYLFKDVADLREFDGTRRSPLMAFDPKAPTASRVDRNKEPVDPHFSKVSSGWSHFLLLTSQDDTLGERQPHQIYVLGDNRFYQLGVPSSFGHSSNDCKLLPLPFFSLSEGFPSKVSKIATGGRHNCVLTFDGDLYVWGWNEQGQLGLRSRNEEDQGRAIPQPTLVQLYDDQGDEVELDVKDVDCGSCHTIIVTENGDVWVTGCKSDHF